MKEDIYLKLKVMKQLYQVQIEWHYKLNSLCKSRTTFIVLADTDKLAIDACLDTLSDSEDENVWIDNALCNTISEDYKGVIYCQTQSII